MTMYVSLPFGFPGWVGYGNCVEVFIRGNLFSFEFLSFFADNVMYTSLATFLCRLYFFVLYTVGFLCVIKRSLSKTGFTLRVLESIF